MGMELTAAVETGLRDEAEDEDWEVVLYVRQALKSVIEGDDELYNELMGYIPKDHPHRDRHEQEALLFASLKALAKSVSCIDVDNQHHQALLSSIDHLSMWQYGEPVIDAFAKLLVAMATSSGKLFERCLDTLVRNFCPPSDLPPTYLLNMLSDGSKKEKVLDVVHEALFAIANLVPLMPSILALKVCKGMPRSPAALTVVYVENMLRLESGKLREFLGKIMLKALMDSLLELDVEIVIEPIILEDSSKGIFEMELEDIEENDDDEENIGHEVSRGTLNRHSLDNNQIADKLDGLMVLTCEHLKSCADAGRLHEVFETLMESFEMTVMTAIKSKFSQFVLFYACSLDPDCCGVKFAVRLADIFLDKGKAPDIRMVAVSYLASYLSRGRFITVSFVANILQRLVDWCFEYCHMRVGELNPTAYRVFYSGCQAIMYVLCFRMRSMMDLPHFRSQLFHMPLKTILQHSLNPLEVCLPSIVEEFLRQAKAAELFTASEKFLNNSLLESDLSKAFGGNWRLDMFFPFDPCLLKRTDRFIRPNYMFWSNVKTTYDREGESEEDGDLEQFSDDEDDVDMDEFESSMNKMSITPGKNILVNGLPCKRMPARIQPSTSPW